MLLQGLVFSQSNHFRCCNGATIPHIFKIVKSSRGVGAAAESRKSYCKEARKMCIICEEPAGPLCGDAFPRQGGLNVHS